MGGNFLCMLIDDDTDDQEIFSMAIGAADNTIGFKGIEDPLIAVELLQQRKIMPNCIFVDLNMPRMNGEQCLFEIKKMAHLSLVPVYIYSTSLGKGLTVRFAAAGAAGYITKPSTLPELSGILQKLLVTHDKHD